MLEGGGNAQRVPLQPELPELIRSGQCMILQLGRGCFVCPCLVWSTELEGVKKMQPDVRSRVYPVFGFCGLRLAVCGLRALGPCRVGLVYWAVGRCGLCSRVFGHFLRFGSVDPVRLYDRCMVVEDVMSLC